MNEFTWLDKLISFEAKKMKVHALILIEGTIDNRA
jgi:hypothetical protein